MKASTTPTDAVGTANASSGDSLHDEFRLRAGYFLYRGPDSAWRLAGPDDTLQRIHVPADVGDALQRICTHGLRFGVAREQVDDPAVLASAIEALEQQGCLISADDARDPGPPSGCVAVVGGGAVADRLSRLLQDCGVRVVIADNAAVDTSGAAMAQADLFVACADWLPDSRWLALDALAYRHGVPWHRVHCEGPR